MTQSNTRPAMLDAVCDALAAFDEAHVQLGVKGGIEVYANGSNNSYVLGRMSLTLELAGLGGFRYEPASKRFHTKECLYYLSDVVSSYVPR